MRCASFFSTVIARRIECAGHPNNALVPAHQYDPAVFLDNGISFDHALVVHHILNDLRGAECGQDNLPAIGLDRTAVVDLVTDGVAFIVQHRPCDGLGNGKVDQPVPDKVHGHFLTGNRTGRPKVGNHDSLVLDTRRNKSDKVRGTDGPLV